MKKVLIIVLIIVLGISANSQQIELIEQLTNQDYLQKSKGQNTAAWIFTGGGAALVISGLAVRNSQRSFFPNETTGNVLMICGAAAITTGVILFIASARNKNNAGKKDRAFNLKLEKAVLVQNAAVRNNYFPALSLNIRLK
ncbi:MAG: hypothetical protein Q8941_08625 [Bacteroidota bacterium]|nr:hypothetical protein [Bacteroidota bacterium]